MAYTQEQINAAREWATGKTGAEIQAKAQELKIDANSLGGILGYTPDQVAQSGFGTASGMNQGLLGEVYGGYKGPTYDQSTINTVYEQQRRAGENDAGILGAAASLGIGSDQVKTAQGAFDTKLQDARNWASGKSADEILAKAADMGLSPAEVGMIFGKDGGTGPQVTAATNGYNGKAGSWSGVSDWGYTTDNGWSQKKKTPQTPYEYSQTSEQLAYKPVLNRQVDAANETIEGRIKNLLGVDANGNYTNQVVRQAAERAMQQFAGRGLLNSSMAQQAAYEAAIAKAIDIAGPDAKTYFEQGRANQDASNVFSRDNQSYFYDLGKIQAQGDQTIRTQNNQNAFTSGENNANRQWQSGENAANRGWQSGENSTNRTWQSGENAANRAAQLQQSANSVAASLQSAQISSGTQLQVADLNRQYGQMSNLSQTSYNLLSSFNTTIGNIATSDLDSASKDKLIGQASTVLRGSMQMLGAINGDTNMGALFDSVFPSTALKTGA